MIQQPGNTARNRRRAREEEFHRDFEPAAEDTPSARKRPRFYLLSGLHPSRAQRCRMTTLGESEREGDWREGGCQRDARFTHLSSTLSCANSLSSLIICSTLHRPFAPELPDGSSSLSPVTVGGTTSMGLLRCPPRASSPAPHDSASCCLIIFIIHLRKRQAAMRYQTLAGVGRYL